MVDTIKAKEAELIRKILPNHFFSSRFAALGGSAKDAISGLFFNKNIYDGGLINSSRAILFSEASER